MRFLFIGGNGNISWQCVEEALRQDHEVWELNRGATSRTRRTIQPGVHHIAEDINCIDRIREKLGDATWDVVCDFICFDAEDAARDITLFTGRTKRFIFISSEAVYRRAGHNLPYREDCEQYDGTLAGHYIGGKIKAEQVFRGAWEEEGFPLIVVRPAYTYDTIVPVSVGHNCFSAPQRLLDGYPALIAGDGTNLWSFTHAIDFARAFVPLAENPDAVGEAFHIATDEWLSWNEETEILMQALGIREYQAVHIPYAEALSLDAFQPQELMAQRMWHNIYDTSKVKIWVPGWHAEISFEEGIGRTIAWLMEDPVRRRIVPKRLAALDTLYKKYGGVG